MSAAIRMSAIDLPPNVRGTFRRHEPMSLHTSWRVGGAADFFFVPSDLEDLSAFLRWLPDDVPVVWLGLGSNLLIRDGGFRGAVVCTHKGLSGIETSRTGRVSVQAGVPCAKVARRCAEANLSGAEFLAGIPGTMGGALAMNAGAFGSETWDLVQGVHLVCRDGAVVSRGAEAFEVGYRHVALPPDMWFVSAELRLVEGDVVESKGKIRQLLSARADSQPIQSANAGSVFRNPDNDYAARLIEQTGLKGRRRGDAEVSRQHANFIVNRGRASARDIEDLIEEVRQEVRSAHGVELVPEVRVIGEFL